MDLASVYRDAGSPVPGAPSAETRPRHSREEPRSQSSRRSFDAGGLGGHADAGRRDDSGPNDSSACGRHLGATRHCPMRLNSPRSSHFTPSCRHVEATTRQRVSTTKGRWQFVQRRSAHRNPEYADAQAGLALALANLGERGSALRNAASAEATGRAHLRTMLRSLPERQSLNYAAVRPKALDLILSLSEVEPGIRRHRAWTA